jgi:NADH-quinone oxidoreductase subunit J
MLHTIAFYLFSFMLLFSATMVVAAKNPVHAVLFLILCFFNAAALFLMLGAEFVALILVIVYVGAVAVLFLFVVMMLDIDFAKLRAGFLKYLPIGGAVGLVLMVELIVAVSDWHSAEGAISAAPEAAIDNTRAIGRLLYTDYVFPFQVSGLILLIAMIGAIVLTLRHKPGVRRQNSTNQLDRKISDVIEIKKVESGKGVL